MSAFRFRYEVAGGHTHVRLFAGEGLGFTLGKCGDLTFRNDEWSDFSRAINALSDVPNFAGAAFEIVPEEA